MADVRDNPDKNRFELDIDGAIAFATYRRNGDTVMILHTEVPRHLEGQGIGSRLVAGVLDLIRAQGLKAAPMCSFVRFFIREHPEYVDLVP